MEIISLEKKISADTYIWYNYFLTARYLSNIYISTNINRSRDSFNVLNIRQ